MINSKLLDYFGIQRKGLWFEFFKQELYLSDLKSLLQDLAHHYATGDMKICPKYAKQVFRAFSTTPLEKVKVVILGQDPYPNTRQADGLAFSSADETGPLPKSLQNIQKELENEGFSIRGKRLDNWAKQGVLLLNTALTCEEGKPGVHRGQEGRTKLGTRKSMEKEYGYGWEHFTFNALKYLINYNSNVLFLAWGKDAANLLNSLKAIEPINALYTTHPSPLSAHKGFLGSNCFLRVNDYLRGINKSEIDWKI